MATSHKKQHYVPKSYLEAWVDPNMPNGHTPFVWVFPKGAKVGRKKSPKKLFTETDFYTLTNDKGERILTLEHGLSQLESNFAGVRRKLERRETLKDDDITSLIAFVAAMSTRTLGYRQHWRDQLAPAIDMTKKLENWLASATPEEVRAVASSMPRQYPTIDVEAIYEKPIQELFSSMFNGFFSVLKNMRLIIAETNDPVGFITSDDPVTMGSPSHEANSIYEPSLYSQGMNIEMAISPQFALALHWGHKEGLYKAPQIAVDELNRRVRLSSYDSFVVNRNFVKDYWFAEIPRL